MRPLQIAMGSSSSACRNLDDKDMPIKYFFVGSISAFLLIIIRCTDVLATSLSTRVVRRLLGANSNCWYFKVYNAISGRF
jgi:hypothetical protein